MMITLRRLLVTALIGLLAGLGVMTALLARHPRRRPAAEAEVLTPVHRPSPPPRKASGWRPAVVLACLLLLMGLTGIVYENRVVLFGPVSRSPDIDRKPLASLTTPRPEATPPSAPAGERATGTVRTPEPGTAPANPPEAAAPRFDIVRVEPDGSAVIAGRAAPNAAVAVLVDGKPVADTRADANGHFTLLPPPLPAGSSGVDLRATDANGATQRSAARVAVMVAPNRDAKPLVALTSPDKPTVVLSRPDGPNANRSGSTETLVTPALPGEAHETPGPDRPAAGGETRETAASGRSPGAGPAVASDTGSGHRTAAAPPTGLASPARESARVEASADAAAHDPKVVGIDIGDGGRLLVTATADAGANLRLYLNNTLIAPATVGRDGTVTFTIGHGVRPGAYKVRLDLVDPASGKVHGRAEIPFTAPADSHDGGTKDAGASRDDPGLIPGSSTSERRVAQDAAPRHEPPTEPASAPESDSRPEQVSPAGGDRSSAVYVPGIETTRIVRGDNLWTISRRTYGEGERYTLIYDANREQIRDPDLIYPGQIFVLPIATAPGTE